MARTPQQASDWLDDKRYRLIRDSVPIACVDALVYSVTDQLRFGLIRREVPAGAGWSEGWALVGGRVRRGEALSAALDRHLRDTLGPDVVFDLTTVEFQRPSAVGQYFPDEREGFSFDPRQHSIALTYLVPLEGRVVPSGEATAFRWFNVADLPPRHEIGFEQGAVVDLAVDALAGH